MAAGTDGGILRRLLSAVRRDARQLASLAILLVAAEGIAQSLPVLDRIYAVRSWLTWPLLTIWGWDLALTAACAGFGRFVLLRVLRITGLSPLAAYAFALPLGLVGFGLGMFAGGYLGLYGPVFAVALPLAMSATWPLTLGMSPRLPRPDPLGRLPLLATAFGVACLGIVYLEVLSPDSVNFDATWCHLVVAQDYAREGRIVPFIADWSKNLAHFASVIQTWCFLVPSPWPIEHPVRWMLALHTEFTVFLWTLVSVSALVEWLCGGRVQAGWAAFFLFPSIFVYDSNLGGAADHVAALFAAPLLLAGARAARSLAPRDCALLGILGAGATATKLQAASILAPIAVLACRWLWLALRKSPGSPDGKSLAAGIAVGLACFAVVVCPQSIESWVWYKNPAYPWLQGVFTKSAPSMPGGAELAAVYLRDWHMQPPPELAQRTIEALKLLVSFSFEVHYTFIGNIPYFGSLFTLMSPMVLFLPRARRVWMAVAVGTGAIFIWAFTYRVERNLQIVLPILAATTGAILVRSWRLGTLARLGVAALVALQLCWGSALVFNGNDRIQSAISLIKSGLDGRTSSRFDDYRRPYREVGRQLPQGALAVLHHSQVTLGMNRRILLDWAGWQALIDYRAMRTPREIYNRLATLGVTHVITAPGTPPADFKQEDVLFDTFVALYARKLADVEGFVVYAMPDVAPAAQAPFAVLALGLDGYPDGIYGVADLGMNEWVPPAMKTSPRPQQPLTEPGAVSEVLGQADAFVFSASMKLGRETYEVLAREFRLVGSHGSFLVYARAARP